MSGKEQLFEVSLEREGAYRSISAALEAAERCVPDVTVPVRVLVAPGEYREQVEIRRPYVTLEGETADSVRIVGGLGAKMPRKMVAARMEDSAPSVRTRCWSMPTT